MHTHFEIDLLASGSKGNSALIRAGGTAILIDAGISCRRIVQGLQACGLTPEDLYGIFLTHEHRDHIAGLEVFCKHHTEIPVFANERTWEAMPLRRQLERSQMRVIPRSCTLGSLRIASFKIPHDAADPVGYQIFYGDEKCTYLTDCGVLTDTCERAVDGAEALILEANHDEEMLKAGPYPADLKRRILGREGHLSNLAAGKLLASIGKPPREVFLAHLSEVNNNPETAFHTVHDQLETAGLERQVTLYVGNQHHMVSNIKKEGNL
ncbi:MAG: MBL fold metallo-hydrolase [Acidaminococcus sp.]|jgi:phosphoribosyl 1,2-cyclic phosphodiesterase|nr:MBL fold metallo-hydrolase [Acidaminococcus sp.]MCI2100460.1 MBL fold metallo-hydrolase [Acidaminococcus sp.]MCI2114781.1 MBL fold metallo-hydrolase [Acidaminococcus sp.]MCI2116834.1 MBL fold metallo-hydrolase [Acidaminococcus sp.]